jgi:hypothetical protein
MTNGSNEEQVELADIHGLYQDLFLTDIRQEVEQA